MVPSLTPLSPPVNSMDMTTAEATIVESEMTFILGNGILNRVTNATTTPSPGATRTLARTSNMTPNPRITHDSMHQNHCSV